MNRLGTILVVASLLVGILVSFAVSRGEHVLTCRDTGKAYERHNRGFPLAFASGSLEIPACKQFSGPRCAVATCDNFRGLKEAASFQPVPLLADIAVWGLFTAGILYMASAFIIKT